MKAFLQMRHFVWLAASLMLVISTQVTQAQDEEDPPIQARDLGADAQLIDPGDDGRTIDPGDDGRAMDPGNDEKAMEPGNDERAIEPGNDEPAMEPGGADVRQPTLQPTAPDVQAVPRVRTQIAPVKPTLPLTQKGFNPQPEPPAAPKTLP